MYEYDRDNANNAVIEAKKAKTNFETIPSDVSSAVSLAASVQVSGLEFLSEASIVEDINIINDYDSIITGMINDIERNLIIECVENGNVNKLVEYVNAGKITTQTLIEYGKEYMIDVMNKGKLDSYNIGHKVIGGENCRYYTINSALKDLGFNDKFIYNLSNEFCKNLINNDAMYTKKGAVTMAISTVGFLSILGLKLGYEHKSYTNSYNGFYFTNGVNNDYVLGGIDCCNFTDWIVRSVGIDISARDVENKYKYVEDGITDSKTINMDSSSEYFKSGEGGDWLISPTHIMMVIENDGKGYYVIEDGGYAEINYYTYLDLKNEQYKITNTDSLYRNTAVPEKNELIMIEEDGSLCDFSDFSKTQSKTQVFADPDWIIKQDNINLTPTEQKKLYEQYNNNNKNSESYNKKFTLEYLTASKGNNNGPEAYETFYDLPMSQVVKNMETEYGYKDVTYDVRSDGVKVISLTSPDGTRYEDLVMVAADVRHDIVNKEGTYERGQIVDTSLGKGIVADYCDEAVRRRENDLGKHFDIATAWHTEPYKSQIYSEEEKDEVIPVLFENIE